MKKLISVLLAALCAGGAVALYGCSDVGDIMYNGNFSYGYISYAGAARRSKDGDYVVILELTDDAKTKDTIIVPDEIDGKPVVQIGMGGLGYSYSILYGSTFTNLYLPKSLKTMTNHIEYNNRKIFIIEVDNFDFIDSQYRDYPIYISEDLYNKYMEEKATISEDIKLYIANVEFISDDKTYFIADYDEGETITYVPEAPEKEGYEFGGWYKEEECENEWNFEEDTFTLAEGQTVMKLYAKWI